MTILNALQEDLTQILELQKLCYKENAERYNDHKISPLVQTIQDLEKEYTDCLILKVVDQYRIIGSIRAFEKDGTCYIGKVIVHPDYQNKGIGTKLMTEIESKFNYVLRYELFTGYKDEKNLHFYDKLCYKQFKEIEIGNNGFKMVYLEKIK
jgi:ribosomal protein S18 acetylase RimI-like enzyme